MLPMMHGSDAPTSQCMHSPFIIISCRKSRDINEKTQRIWHYYINVLCLY